MIGWLITLAYLLIAGWTFKRVVLLWLDKEATKELARRDRHGNDSSYLDYCEKGPLVSDLDRQEAYLLGSFAGITWPLFWPGRLLFSFLRAITNGWETPTEARLKERQELEHLRELAEKHGLDFPREG